MDGIDTYLGLILLAVVTGLLIWQLAMHVTRSRRRSVPHMIRHAKRVIRERGIEHRRPRIEIHGPGHALIRWTEDGQERAILLTWHHMLDGEHRHPDHEENNDR